MSIALWWEHYRLRRSMRRLTASLVRLGQEAREATESLLALALVMEAAKKRGEW